MSVETQFESQFINGVILPFKEKLLAHPIVHGTNRGTLSRSRLKGWLKQRYWNLKSSVDSIFLCTYFMPTNESKERTIHHASEEVGHPELLFPLARELGMAEEEVKREWPLPQNVYFNCMKVSMPLPFMEGVTPGMIIAPVMEATLTEKYLKMREGLKRHYGISDGGLVFFNEHIEVDKGHGIQGVKALLEVADREDLRARSLHLAAIVSQTYLDLLGAIYQHYGQDNEQS